MQGIAPRRLPPLALLAVLTLCLLPEALLQGADLGLWGDVHWRSLAYGWFGFWPGLLQGWRPNFPFQAVAMFVTYGFFHVGLLHLAVNMLTLWSLGPVVIDRVGSGGFLWVYAAAMLGGGVGFGLLTTATVPMVGASGALFGLMGAMIAWSLTDRRREAESLWPVARAVLGLVLLNLVLWVVAGGQLAWQTHLGGGLAGAAMALWLDRGVGRAA